MRNRLILIVCFFMVGIIYLRGQTKPNTYVDRKGIWRWTNDNREVNEFGVNYALPFSTAYQAFRKLNLSYEKGIEEDVYHLSRLGINAYRIHVWDSEISDTLGNLMENNHLRLLDYTFKQMKDRGFKIVITPLNFYETQEKEYGLGQKYGKKGSFTSEAVKATENYLFQFMNHVNLYTGIAYKNDPDIIAFELYNEPEHHGQTEEEAKLYVNRLVNAVRRSGCRKPLFYCMSIAPQLRKGFLEANIQGGSSQWYPLSHNAGFEFKGNLLTYLNQWPKDSLTDDIKAKNKALLAYEIDAADNGYSYTYPMMARTLRSTGFQFAAMFTYDPLGIAYSNVEYRTHFMNMAYSPQKALALKIAGEVFHKIPRGMKFLTYPIDTVFDVFRLSYSENLAEMVTAEKFMYTNNTHTMPPQPSKLKEIAGYGSSSIVQYNGRGIYFLDKLEDGIWRLEVMPDATWVADPFSNPTLEKEVSAIVWNTWPMTINLPDLGNEYSMIGINEGNMVSQVAIKKQILVSPGTYILRKKGVISKWKPDDKWKNITLKEFVAPPPTSSVYMIHHPVGEMTKGRPNNVDIEIISSKEAGNVKLCIYTRAPEKFRLIDFKKISRYGYTATIPEDLLNKEDVLDYQIYMDIDGEHKIYPENVDGPFVNFSNTPMYSIHTVKGSYPISLLDVENDCGQMRRAHRQYRYIFHSSCLPGKLGLELGTNNLIYTSFYFKDKIIGRMADISTKKQLLFRGTALSDQPVKTWIILQLKDGKEYGTRIELRNDQLEYKIPLKNLEPIKVTGPGEKGIVFIDPFLEKDKKEFDIREAETIKIAVLPVENKNHFPVRAVVEFIMLE
jgi:hypothetical protein